MIESAAADRGGAASRELRAAVTQAVDRILRATGEIPCRIEWRKRIKMTGNSGNSRQPREGAVHGRMRSTGESWRRHRPILKFVAATLSSLVLFFLVLRTDWFGHSVGEPYTRFVAATSRLFLRLIGVQAFGSGSVVSSPEFTVNIMNVCNGLEATAIYFATVLGFPASWKDKLIGCALGYPVIYLINILRIAALFLIGYKVPHVFETVHYYYAQAFVILATVGVWLVWVSKYSVYGSKSRNRPAD